MEYSTAFTMEMIPPLAAKEGKYPYAKGMAMDLGQNLAWKQASRCNALIIHGAELPANGLDVFSPLPHTEDLGHHLPRGEAAHPSVERRQSTPPPVSKADTAEMVASRPKRSSSNFDSSPFPLR